MTVLTVSLTVLSPDVNVDRNNINSLHHQLDGCMSHHIEHMAGGRGLFFHGKNPQAPNGMNKDRMI
jgi:hypothetical protein